MEPTIIKTINISKRYKNLLAVDDLNIEIGEGEIFGLLGPNGAGKTTLISVLCTIIKPTSGTALVNGFDILKKPREVRKSIGIVFQAPSVDDLLTGRENLRMHTLLFRMDRNLRKKRIDEVLSLVNLEERADDLVRTYSGGMRRRLELARGLMHHPKVLFLDEPTLGLDPQTRENIWTYIRKLNQEEKITILLTTHYMDEAEMLCNRVGIIDFGKIIALDAPENLKRQVVGDIVILKQKNPEPEKLKKLRYIRKIESMDDQLYITMEDVCQNLQDLLRNTGDIECVEVRSGTLNDVFLHYTGRSIREEGAEGGFWERIMSSGGLKR